MEHIIFPICNKKSDRAPKIFGHTFVLCWRCSMVIVGIVSTRILVELVFKQISWRLMIFGMILLVPMIIDGICQYAIKNESTNVRRAITGFLLGIGAALVIAYIFG